MSRNSPSSDADPNSSRIDVTASQRLPRTRAVDAQDRERRRLSILNAAEQLFANSATRDLSMSEVAALAGLAKGTVYLYYESKEVLILSLHERLVEAFFRELIEALETAPVFGFDQLARIVRRHMTEQPLYMSLGSVAMGFMDQQTIPEALQNLSDRISRWLIEAGSKLEARFTDLPAGEGVRMLVHGYAQIVGLWHLLAVPCAAATAAQKALGSLNYADEAECALARYWASTMTPASLSSRQSANPTKTVTATPKVRP
jgi:AcrR family transcriptional regulator